MQNDLFNVLTGTPPHTPPPQPLPPPPTGNNTGLLSLESNNDLDFRFQYEALYNDENLYEDPYSNINLCSKFYDMDSVLNLSANGHSLYLSLNIQSLNSKFDEFQQFITELQQKNVNIDVIALQETWEILYPDQLMLPGFQKIVYKNRKGMRGGGGGLLC